MKAKNHSESTKRPERITPVQPPAHKDIGFSTSIVEQAVAAGPAGLRNAQRIAINCAKKYLVDAEDHWKQDTQFLRGWQTSLDARYRAHARYARRWRPRFLAALSVTHSPRLSSDYAGIQHQTAYNHRKLDPEFAKQWDDAQDRAIELLHARAFQRALEGDLEPVYYMGEPVGYVRKFDSKLQIELLRAHLPQKFKSPGTQVNIGTRSDVFVLTEEQRAHLRELNRKWLESAPLTPRPFASGSEHAPVPALGAPPALPQGEREASASPQGQGYRVRLRAKAEGRTPRGARARTTTAAKELRGLRQ